QRVACLPIEPPLRDAVLDLEDRSVDQAASLLRAGSRESSGRGARVLHDAQRALQPAGDSTLRLRAAELALGDDRERPEQLTEPARDRVDARGRRVNAAERRIARVARAAVTVGARGRIPGVAGGD